MSRPGSAGLSHDEILAWLLSLNCVSFKKAKAEEEAGARSRRSNKARLVQKQLSGYTNLVWEQSRTGTPAAPLSRGVCLLACGPGLTPQLREYNPNVEMPPICVTVMLCSSSIDDGHHRTHSWRFLPFLGSQKLQFAAMTVALAPTED